MSILNYRVSTDENLQPLTGKSWKEWCDLFDDWEEETNNLSTISMFRCFSEAEAWDYVYERMMDKSSGEA